MVSAEGEQVVSCCAQKLANDVRFVPIADGVVELNPPHKSLCRPGPQPAIEQTAPALARHEIDVAHQFCAAFTPRQHNLAAVKRFKLGAMGDADQRRPRELLGHEPIILS